MSVLLSRLHPDAQRIDGKGGDGGRDVQIVSQQEAQINEAFELKSFTGRMNQHRRRQVSNSLKRAATLEPALWTLVVPIDPTPAEVEWFRKLGTGYRFPIKWRGKTWLDEKMSAFPDIRRYYVEGAKDEVFRFLLQLHKEQAKVTDLHDAAVRLRTLYEHLNEIDPQYRYEMSTVTAGANSWPSDVVFSVKLGDVRFDAYPKYLRAVNDRPVSIRFTLALEPEDRMIRDALGYGLDVSIPQRVISGVTIDAPAGLGGSFTEAELNLSPTNTRLDQAVTVPVDIMDGSKLIASCPVHFTERTAGTEGFILTGADSTGWLETRLTVNVADNEIQAELRLNPKPAMPTALVPLFRWLDALHPPRHFKMRWDDGFELLGEVESSLLTDGSLRKVVECLAYLQDRTCFYWEMPSSIDNEEAREIVSTAALMKGETIDLRWKYFNMSLHQWGQGLKELESGGSQQVIAEGEISLKLQGGEIPIGRVRTHLLSARLADPESVRRDLESGAVPRLRLVPGDSDKAQQVLVP